jgi:HAE1 family hydrophobic/amphiphilic exporter-1
MKRYRFGMILLILAWVLSSTPVLAEFRLITLSECMDLTVQYSREMLLAQEGINQSKGLYVAERSAALPQLTASMGMIHGRDESMALFPDAPVEGNQYQGNLNLTQALFTWGKIGAAINAAKYDAASAEQQYRQARQLALREAATRFYDLILTIELEKVAQDNVAQKQRHLDETKRKHQMGVATDYDVLAAQVALANARPGLTRAANDIRLARDRLRYYMGVTDDFEATGVLSPVIDFPAPLEEIIQKAIASRPEMAYADSRIGVFKELATVAEAGDKPRIDFEGNLGWKSFDNMNFDYPGQSWNAGIYFSIPLFDGFKTKGSSIQARSRLSVAEIEKQKLADTISLEARDAVNQALQAIEIVRALEATLTQAERLLQMAEAGYRAGVKTRLEVDDAEFNLQSARSNLAIAKRDTIAAQIQLLWIKGEDIQAALAKG